MASIPSGTYESGGSDSVTVGAFCLGVTEVTASAYGGCVKTGACTGDGLGCSAGATFGAAGKGNHPMNCVDWNQATAYCRAQGKRLPTAKEWEWAARGGSEAREYPWGPAEPGSQLCWSGGSSRSGTCAVGSFPAGNGRWGLQDMAGNVWEWTSSQWIIPDTDRVIRGGSWDVDAAAFVRTVYVCGIAPSSRIDIVGFRCAR